MFDDEFLERYRRDGRVTDFVSEGLRGEWRPAQPVARYAWDLRRYRGMTLRQASLRFGRFVAGVSDPQKLLSSIERGRLSNNAGPRIFVEELFALALTYDVSPLVFLIPPTPHVSLLVGWSTIDSFDVANVLLWALMQLQDQFSTKTWTEDPSGTQHVVSVVPAGYGIFWPPAQATDSTGEDEAASR